MGGVLHEVIGLRERINVCMKHITHEVTRIMKHGNHIDPCNWSPCLRCVVVVNVALISVYTVIFLSLNLWRPPSVALYLKRSHDLGTCKKAVVESLFWEMTFTSSHLLDRGYGTNCHFQEAPPVLRVVGSDGAAKYLLVHPVLALAETWVRKERLSSAMVANSQWSLEIVGMVAGTPSTTEGCL